MRVNIVAVSGKLDDSELFVYSKIGKRYRLYYIKVNNSITLPVVTKEDKYVPTSDEIVVFGKMISLYDKIAIWGVDFKVIRSLGD
jgi:hypothetical protein